MDNGFTFNKNENALKYFAYDHDKNRIGDIDRVSDTSIFNY